MVRRASALDPTLHAEACVLAQPDRVLVPRSSPATSFFRRGSFTSTDELAAKIDAYAAWYLETDRLFRWSYRPKSWTNPAKSSVARHQHYIATFFFHLGSKCAP